MRFLSTFIASALTVLAGVDAFALSTNAGTQQSASRIVCPNGKPRYGYQDGVCHDAGHYGSIGTVAGFPEMPLSVSQWAGSKIDFLGLEDIPTTGDTIVNNGQPWFVYDNSAAGSPTKAVIADADNGQYALTLAATNEVEVLSMTWSNELNIDSDQEPVIVYRLSINADFPTATTTLVFGLGSDQNDTEDSVTQNAWFRFQGDLAMLLESDDNSTDSDDKSTGVTLTADTMYEFMVCASSLCGGAYNDVRFFYRASLGGQWIRVQDAAKTVFKVAADTQLQPYLQLRKAANTDTDGVKIEYINAFWNRN